MGKFAEKAKTTLVATASGGVGFALAGFLLRDWDFSGWQLTQPIATIIASIIGLTAAGIAFDNGQKTREQDKEIHEAKSRAEQERTLRERFTSIVELLATDDLTKRESGAYALAALADDWAAFYKYDQKSALREQQVCLNTLISLLREPISSEQDERKLLFKERIQEIIFSRFKNPDNNKDKNRESGIWSDLKPELKECHFYNLDTKGAYFNQGISFVNSTFTAETSFSESTFKKCANFSGSEFFGITLFARLNFTGLTLFDRATFNSATLFCETKFDCEAYFEDVDFLGRTYFFSADTPYAHAKNKTEFLRAASLNGARFFKDTIFSNVIFHQNASFLDAQFRSKYKEEAEVPDRVQFHETTFFTSSFDGSIFAAPENHPDIIHLKHISSLGDAKNTVFNASDFPKCREKFHSLRSASKTYQFIFHTDH